MGISVYTKIAMFSLALIVSAGVYVALGQLGEPLVVENTLDQKGIEAVRSSLTEMDTDHDGLHDWEETLWGTDPNDADTDSDGVLDGDEVAQNRDPNVPGPHDQLGVDAIGNVIATSTNLTDIAAKEFFGQYITLKQRGIAMDEKAQEELVASIVQSVPKTNVEVKFTLQDIEIISDSTGAALYTYGNELGEMLDAHTPKDRTHELDIFAQALEKEDAKELARLDPIIEGYRGVVKDLQTMQVPQAVSKEHVVFLNEAAGMLKVIEGMRLVFDDPVQTLSVMGSYETRVNALAASLHGLGEFMRNHNIQFINTDGGYFLMNV